jgi:hypothetical protein
MINMETVDEIDTSYLSNNSEAQSQAEPTFDYIYENYYAGKIARDELLGLFWYHVAESICCRKNWVAKLLDGVLWTNVPTDALTVYIQRQLGNLLHGGDVYYWNNPANKPIPALKPLHLPKYMERQAKPNAPWCPPPTAKRPPKGLAQTPPGPNSKSSLKRQERERMKMEREAKRAAKAARKAQQQAQQQVSSPARPKRTVIVRRK